MATKTGQDEYLKLLQLALDFQNNRGTSFLELLTAIFIIGTVLAVSAPILALVAASQVHTRQVEQAMDLAQSEIDLIQTRMNRGVSVRDNQQLPPKVTSGELTDAPPPNDIKDDTDSPAATAAFKVDVDKNNEPDFLVQTFRNKGMCFGSGSSNKEVAVFRMGVRVYSMAAEDNLMNNRLETQVASLQFSGKERTTRPLVAFYTEISRSDLPFSLHAYERYLAGSETNCSSDSS